MSDEYNDYFGDFGGRYVAEILRTALDELEIAWKESMKTKGFVSELQATVRKKTG